MKVLTTSEEAQILEVIPRVYTSNVSIELRDDSKNTTQTYTAASTNVRGYLRVSNAYSLVEGRFYDLTLFDIEGEDIRDYKERVLADGGTYEFNENLLSFVDYSDLIYKDKVFCTDQDVDQDLNEYYSVNDGVYTEEAGDNEFIII